MNERGSFAGRRCERRPWSTSNADFSFCSLPSRVRMTAMTAATTPPFLAWALAQSCPLRNIERWAESERTERHLRAIVEYAKGASDERVIDGVCLGPECLKTDTADHDCTGFVVDEALAMFGGLTAVEECCAACPANVMQPFMN